MMNNLKNDHMNLTVERASRYDGSFAHYQLPVEIGCYSTDAEGRFRKDGHQMKYLSMPDEPTDLWMDLNEGFREYIHIIDDSDNTYTGILKWILSDQGAIKKHFVDRFTSSPAIDFIVPRGVLTTVSSSIYGSSKDWLIYATKFRSAIYLYEFWTKRESEARETATEKQIRMASWGFKFEQYMVSDRICTKPDTSVPVNENEKYRAVFKGKLGHHRMLFTAEMDAVDPEHFNTSGCDSTSPLRYVELKTSRVITSRKEDRNFRRFKLLKWYLQSYFAGVPQIICGFRDDEGIVRKLGLFDVRDIPKQARGLWSPSACLNFTSHFLDHVKKHVVEEEVVYEFYFQPGSGVITCELSPDSTFLPEWYTSKVTVI